MSDLKSKVFELLEEAGTDIQTLFFYADIESEHNEYDSEELTELKNQLDVAGIRFELKDRYGGEDMGSDYWSIYAFSDSTDTVFIKFNGWYASHVGSEYQEFYAVIGKEKTVVEYEKQ